MPDTLGSFDAFLDATLPSLASVLSAFEALPDEKPGRKTRVRTAVASISRLLNKPADQIPGSAVYLKQRFIWLRRAPTALSAKSLANCKSELGYLLKKVIGKGARSALAPLSPEWVQLRAIIPEGPAQWKLSRFMSYSSNAGREPGEVDDDLVAAYREAVNASGDINRPDQHVRQAIRTWNSLAEALAEWPKVTLSLPARQIRRWTIPPENFPQSFRDEVDAWQHGLAHIDPEAEEGRIRPLRPESLKLHRHNVFKAASALVFTGRSIETVTSLSELVEMEAFRAILKHLRERQGGKPTTALLGLASGLKAIAKHQVGVDPKQLAKMNHICKGYARGLEAHVPKTRARAENFQDEKLLAALLHLPDGLLAEASHPQTSKAHARMLAQVAIAIEIEWYAPLRRRNLVALKLSENIQTITVKGQKRWLLRFERGETKNHSVLTYELPADNVRRIERAMKLYEQPDGWLFPGRKGSHKDISLLGTQVKAEVERRLGIPFNLHLFRSLVATMQVTENVNGFEMARTMLGDRTDRVVRTHYTATAERRLIEDAQKTIQKVRVRTAPLAPTAKRRGGSDGEVH
jgi:integrase